MIYNYWKSILALLVAAPLSFADAAETQPVDFIKEYLRELNKIQLIRDDAVLETKENTSKEQQFSACIKSSTAYKLELQGDIGMMQSIILRKPFDTLPNGIAAFYQQKVTLYDRLTDICSKFLEKPDPNVDYGKFTAEVPKMTANLDYIDHSLFETITPLMTIMLVSDKPDSKNHLSHLNITNKERTDLIHTIDIGFADSIKKKDNLYYAESSALLIKNFLEGEHKSFDDPWD